MPGRLTAAKPDTIALLIPAHNEALVLAQTIDGAMAAGVAKKDIYLVDDSSTDETLSIAELMLGKKQVLHVERSGKALALHQAITHFSLIKRYEWVQIIDADSVFSPNYFEVIRGYFKPGVAAVCGQVKSLQGSWISSFRAVEYAVFQDFYKLLQAKFNLVSVMPGPATCFRSSTLAQIDFSNDTLTEDFDMTIQVHYGKMGKIAFAHGAYSWTQDPPTLPTYIKQINRWHTGFFQVLRKHKVGLHLRPIDLMLLLMTLDGFFYIFQTTLFAVLIAFHLNKIDPYVLIAGDFIMLLCLTLYAAIRTRRIDVLTPLPFYYILRLLSIVLFLWAAMKVYIFHRSKQAGSWNTTRVVHQAPSITLATKGGEL